MNLFVRLFVCLFFSNLTPFTVQELFMFFNFSRPPEFLEKCLVSHLCLALWFILYCKGNKLLCLKNSIRCSLKHLPGAIFINMKDLVAPFINPREISYLISRSCWFCLCTWSFRNNKIAIRKPLTYPRLI